MITENLSWRERAARRLHSLDSSSRKRLQVLMLLAVTGSLALVIYGAVPSILVAWMAVAALPAAAQIALVLTVGLVAALMLWVARKRQPR